MLLLMNGGLAAVQFAARAARRGLFPPADGRRLLRVQALFFLANPFIALANALLIRRMDFKRQSQVEPGRRGAERADRARLRDGGPRRLDPGRGARSCSGIARGDRLSRSPRGSGDPAASSASPARARWLRYGGAMILVQFCWFVQSQADVFIGGHLLDAAPARPLHHRSVPDPDPGGEVRAAAERGRLRRLFANPDAART